MTSLLVTGGQQKAIRSQFGTKDWSEYHKGMILGIETKTGERCTSVEYFSPPEATPDDRPEVIFKTGTVQGDRLYLCTQTEVMIYGLPHFELLNYISLPCFNDVHHVRPTSDGNLLVANTGLDMVLLMTKEGFVLDEWNVLGQEPWERFATDIDYRKVDTKPHGAHPNHVFLVGDDIWATRFHLKDAVCLTKPGQRIAINVGLPHDGVVHEGMIYFTTVNGYVVIANPVTLEVEEVIGLTSMHRPDVQLGWCRSILFDDGKTWIGFSRLRSTRFRENVKWVVQGFNKVLPTRVACYDLKKRECITEIDLEPYGLHAIYSIFSGKGFDFGNGFEACDKIPLPENIVPKRESVTIG